MVKPTGSQRYSPAWRQHCLCLYIHVCTLCPSSRRYQFLSVHLSENRGTTFSISNILHEYIQLGECRVYLMIISNHTLAALMTWYKNFNSMSFLGVSLLFCFTLSVVQTTMVRYNSYTLLPSSGFRATLHDYLIKPYEMHLNITWSANFSLGGGSTFTRGQENHQHL